METGRIKNNAADGTLLGHDFFGPFLYYGALMTLSHDFHISTTDMLAYGTVKRNYEFQFILNL